jgi:predicted MFS family arabinose efflux permease
MAALLPVRARFWTAAAVVVVALWSSGAPALVYPVYEQAWGLTPAVITAIFAVYPVVLVVVLVVFGGISDYIGRRVTMLAGLGSIIVGVLIFALAPDVAWLFAGRIFQGIGVGLALSPAGAALVEYGRSASRASSINTLATAVGLTIATVLGGGLVQYAPWPRELTFWVLLVVTVALAVAVFFLPRNDRSAEPGARWRPRPIRVPRSLRGVVTAASLGAATSFAVGAVLISLGAQLIKDVLHTDNALVAGIVLAISSMVGGVVSIAARRLAPRTAVASGAFLGAFAIGLLVVSANLSSLLLFIVTSVIFGAAYGMLFLGSLGLINRYAQPDHRAGTLSVVYLVAYLGQGTVAIGLGLLATALGLAPALSIVGPVLIALALAAGVTAIVAGRPRVVAAADAVDAATAPATPASPASSIGR